MAAEQIFKEIFGKAYDTLDKDQGFTMQEIMSNNIDGESNEMVEHIFEELNQPEKLKPT
jgi:hypothetical protein